MHWKINKETLKQNFSLSIKSEQETCNSLRSKTPFLTCFISSWCPQFNPRSRKMQKNCVVRGQTAFSRLAHINPSGPAHISFHYSLLSECLLGVVQVTISNKYYFTWKRVCSGIPLQLLRSRSNIHTKEKENIILR